MKTTAFSLLLYFQAFSLSDSRHKHQHVFDAVALAEKQSQFYAANWKTFVGVPPEEAFTNWIASLAKSELDFNATAVKEVFIIGCNEGQEIRSFQDIYPNSHIHCFEPMASNMAILSAKGFKNDSRLTVVQSAVSDFDGLAEFVGSGQQATMKRLGSYAGAQASLSAVPVQRLDSYWARLKAPVTNNVWHIDCEGGEFLAFLGATTVLENTLMIIFECADWYGHEAPYNVVRKVNLLEKLGFDTFKLGPTSVLRLNGLFWDSVYDRLNQWSNCVAVKEGTWLHRRVETEITFPNHY